MTDQNAFLRAVCTDPADDLPRLVYADWLDERGEAKRAEFVRAGCELARLAACRRLSRGEITAGSHVAACRYCRLYWERRRLWLDGVGRAVAADLTRPAHAKAGPVFCGIDLGTAVVYRGSRVRRGLYFVRRGFVDEIRLPLRAYLAYAGDLFRRHPVIRVMLTDREPTDGSGRPATLEWFRELPRAPARTLAGRHVVPDTLFRLLPTTDAGRGGNHAAYGNLHPDIRRKKADNALSVACVAYGRGLAGLPPL